MDEHDCAIQKTLPGSEPVVNCSHSPTGWVKNMDINRNVVPFNSDEAVVALMARHILQGERPIFFYGQAYMGSADAYLVATGFWVFGEQVWVIRLIECSGLPGTI